MSKPQKNRKIAFDITISSFYRNRTLLTEYQFIKLFNMKKYFIFIFLFAIMFCVQAQNIRKMIDVAGTDKSFANYDQVTVFDSTYAFMEDNGLCRVKMHKLTKVLTHKGCGNNSVVKIDYDPLSAYVEINKVTVYRKNGDIEVVTNPVLDYVAPARAIYWGASQKMVEVGHLEPGDAVEVEMFRKGFTYALLQADDESKYIPPMRGHFYDIVPFWSSQPILEKVYIVSVLKSKELQYCVYNGEVNSSVKNDSKNDRMIYSFSKKNIMPISVPRSTVSLSDIAPKLLLSTSPDWESKSRWFYGVNEDYGSFNSTPELQKKVNELLKPAKNELDSISILTHWVADNMRYSGISMGEGEGFTLHNAEMNFTDRCGVCKDKASLLIAMLRAAGFKSYAAMTMAGERIDRIPADQFNHSVTIVQRRNGEYQLLDPTWVPGTRELWSSAEQQQNYLMGLPEGADLMETPISPSINHYVYVDGKSELTKDGTLIGEFTITAEGQSDASVRGVFWGRYSEWDNAVEAELLRVDPRAVMISATHTDEEQYLKQPVKFTYKYKIPNYAVVSDKEVIFTPLLAKGVFKRAMSHIYFDTNLEKRDFPFKDRCSRLLKVKETVTVPKYTKVLQLPENKSVSSKYVNYNGKYSLEKRTLTFEQTADYGKRIYEADEWNDFRSAVKAQNDFANTAVIFEK